MINVIEEIHDRGVALATVMAFTSELNLIHCKAQRAVMHRWKSSSTET